MRHKGKEIRIAYLALPNGVFGAAAEDDDYYLIVINESLAAITKRRALGHELCHVFRDHHSGDRPIREVEEEADRLAWDYYRAYRDHRL